VIVVASVSCIYGLGNPGGLRERSLRLGRGQEIERDEHLLRRLVDMQYSATTTNSARHVPRARRRRSRSSRPTRRGAIRVEFFGDEIERSPDRPGDRQTIEGSWTRLHLPGDALRHRRQQKLERA
jgi:excinuclease ABC subunit B